MDTIRSERLDLPLLSAGHVEALLDGKRAQIDPEDGLEHVFELPASSARSS